ncbi:hypothetical protein LNTAR_15172 [Lentisphaera araneosa HTCC2155]|uniref:DNA/RNA non-specific endonuclease/pyrophosphatase/phosphodiesterase domain-containing protein n=1 Tax=Lentisphaera araneosa HTCC2155 TaxID=313628 RepID=A6DRF9_9BACT|nr:DNA/RNA non-specific endonuclease [Lentisphaera araneosa]EDM25769.1 hypothetical protein LNTAR_15172 [Lentisphaera araneosa HTCC2155]
MKFSYFAVLVLLSSSLQANLVGTRRNITVIKKGNITQGYSLDYQQSMWVSHQVKLGERGPIVNKLQNTDGFGNMILDRDHFSPYYTQSLLTSILLGSEEKKFSSEISLCTLMDISLKRNWINMDVALSRQDNTNPVFIINGVVFTSKVKYAFDKGFPIPAGFYKVIYYPDSKQAIAFVMSNKPLEKVFKNYAVPIARLEKLVGYKILEELDDKYKSQVDKPLVGKLWNSVENKDSQSSYLLMSNVRSYGNKIMFLRNEMLNSMSNLHIIPIQELKKSFEGKFKASRLLDSI